MRHRVSYGGMQTASLQYSLYCPKCNRPAFKKEDFGDYEIYSHFGKNTSFRHKVPKTTKNEVKE